MSDLVIVVDVLTGEIMERELTSDEIKERKTIHAAFEKEQKDLEAKAAARTSALAKLKKLGLTAAEIEAL